MSRRTYGVVLVALASLTIATPDAWTSHEPDADRALTFEGRVAAQRAIEEVYWRHRIWPPENPGPKPPLDAVMPESAIRAKVEDYLKKSNALEKWWRRPITAEQLQAELDRMARDTRDPRLLRELFDALGGDASLIVETLARQTLAERLIRSWYASDERFHGALKRKAEVALAACDEVACMREMGGEYHERTAKSDDGEAVGSGVAPRDAVVNLDAEQWKSHLGRLAAKLGGSPDSIPTNRLSGLEDTAAAFMVTAVLSPRKGEIVTATAFWPKRSFDAWWEAQGVTLSIRVEPSARSFTLPAVALTDCVNDTWAPTHQELPDSRVAPTAVWTGTEMIVWGGYVNATGMNTGGRYNPSTDSWTTTSVGPNVPAGRAAHAAVWTGTEMIVWGGDGDGVLNTGGRYDPTTDSWTVTSIGLNVPSARSFHTAVWTGTEMIVWGGRGIALMSYLNTGGRYNPTTDIWTPTSTGPSAPMARTYHTAVWTGADMIVWGGEYYEGGLFYSLDTGGRYRPTTDTWTATSIGANAPSLRQEHAAVWTGTEMIVWGGWGDSDDPDDDSPMLPAVGGRYDPTTDTWTPTTTGASVPASRSDHAAVWTGAEMIVWGGFDANSLLNSGGRYVPATDSWTPTSMGANVPAPRAGPTAIWTGTDMIVWGGGGFLDTGGRYDPTTDLWAPTSTGADVPAARAGHTAVWTGTEMLVWGGSHYDGSAVILLNTGGRYDPTADAWTPTSAGASVPAGRSGHSAVWTGSEMIVWGGEYYDTTSHYLNTGGRYDPTTDSWATTSTGTDVPVPRSGHSAVWTGAEMIVWGGGYYDTTTHHFNTGGRYDPTTEDWTPTSTGANVPSERSRHSAVWTGTEMIVWGGANESDRLSTGGRYDPTTDGWTGTSTGTFVPNGRQLHTAVWTGTEMIVWGADIPTSTGGRYCACPDGRIVYRDTDGDGHGNAAVSSATCDGSIPEGYVIDAMDCEDGDDSIHPGAGETCNGIDDDCDASVDEGLPGPGVPELLADRSGSNASLFLTAAGGVRFDVLKGNLFQLRQAGSFSASIIECLADDTPETSIQDPNGGGIGRWYLAREIGCSGEVGSYNSGSESQHHDRDADIASSAAPCP